jgi:hypothetical protein
MCGIWHRDEVLAKDSWAASEIEMRRKKIFPMTLSELELLSTKQLLSRLKHLRQCEDSLDASDREVGERIPDGSIEFKDDAEWRAEYNRLKTVLANREHIPKGVALVEMRRERARRGKALDRRAGKREPRRPH